MKYECGGTFHERICPRGTDYTATVQAINAVSVEKVRQETYFDSLLSSILPVLGPQPWCGEVRGAAPGPWSEWCGNVSRPGFSPHGLDYVNWIKYCWMKTNKQFLRIWKTRKNLTQVMVEVFPRTVNAQWVSFRVIFFRVVIVAVWYWLNFLWIVVVGREHLFFWYRIFSSE